MRCQLVVGLLVKPSLQKDTGALLLKSLPTKFKLPKMKLDAFKQSEDQQLATKQAARRNRPAPIEEQFIPARKEAAPQPKREKKVPIRTESDSEDEQPIVRRGSGREALYGSWFPSSPRTNHRFPFNYLIINKDAARNQSQRL